MLKHTDQNAPSTEWPIATATIIRCSENLLPGGTDETLHATYTVTFEYEVGSKRYQGTYKRDSPVDLGHQFDISYDPKQPYRNTGTDSQRRSPLSVIFSLILGTAVVIAFLYFEYVY
jgi:hypothetical protein